MTGKHTLGELNNLSREELITIILSMQGQLDALNENVEKLIEQVRLANQYRFGRRAETMESIEGQLTFFDEADALYNPLVQEPDAEEVLPRKEKGKKTMINKIEKGVQLGVEKRIQKGQKFFWYSYALQKKGDIYYVYECEIEEDNMAQELYEYENVCKYLSLEEVQNEFLGKYEISFNDIHVLKGNKIFNVDFYV